MKIQNVDLLDVVKYYNDKDYEFINVETEFHGKKDIFVHRNDLN